MGYTSAIRPPISFRREAHREGKIWEKYTQKNTRQFQYIEYLLKCIWRNWKRPECCVVLARCEVPAHHRQILTSKDFRWFIVTRVGSSSLNHLEPCYPTTEIRNMCRKMMRGFTWWSHPEISLSDIAFSVILSSEVSVDSSISIVWWPFWGRKLIGSCKNLSKWNP